MIELGQKRNLELEKEKKKTKMQILQKMRNYLQAIKHPNIVQIKVQILKIEVDLILRILRIQTYRTKTNLQIHLKVQETK